VTGFRGESLWAVHDLVVWARDARRVEFSCPRCSTAVDERYYGPCTACRTELRATIVREAAAVEAVAYEPKMNVTPNAVALKDD
jgi:hypothetical protein